MLPDVESSLDSYALRDATWLDLPFIFELVLDGSKSGMFASQFLTIGGHVSLLLLLISSIRYFPWTTLRDNARLVVLSHGRDLVGFARLTAQWSGTEHCRVLDLYAIAPAHRRHGHGKRGLMMLLHGCNTPIRVYCGKAAVGMRALLSQPGFHRRTEVRHSKGQLRCYHVCLRKAAEKPAATRRSCSTPRGVPETQMHRREAVAQQREH